MPSKIATAVTSVPSHQLDVAQVSKASTALLKKLQSDVLATSTKAKSDLLADADEEDVSDSKAIWLVLTTKKHIIDKKRLKPGKITLPHPYTKESSKNLRVCLITADPQRKYKDLVAHPSFPTDTAKSIARVIGLEKLKAKYNSYESKRKLLGEYDVFLADDRIISYLTSILGKVFYKSSAKRPIPVSLEGRRQNFDEQGNKRRKLAEGGTKVVKSEPKPTDIAADIERALSSALVHLAPSTTTSVKVGVASMSPQQIQQNVEAVVTGLVDTYVPQKWKNVRAIHIKGATTTALPIWLTDELWTDANEDIRDEAPPAYGVKGKKRKAEQSDVLEVPGADGKMRRIEQSKPSDSQQENGRAARKDSLKKQKAKLNGTAETKESSASQTAKPSKKRLKAADMM